MTKHQAQHSLLGRPESVPSDLYTWRLFMGRGQANGSTAPALEAQRPAPVTSTSKILHGKRTVRPSSASMVKVIGAPPNPAPKLTRSPLYPQKPHQPILVTPHATAIDPYSVCSILVTTNPSSASMYASRAPHQHTTATPVMACSPAIAHPGPIPNTKPPAPGISSPRTGSSWMWCA